MFTNNTYAIKTPSAALPFPEPASLLRLPFNFGLKKIPNVLLSEILARALQLLITDRDDDLQELEGQAIHIRASDLDKQIGIRIHYGQILRDHQNPNPDVIIAGSLDDLLRLALRLEDPDTLFFNRKLSLEGNTSSGLLVKNILDALDPDWKSILQFNLGSVAGNALYNAIQNSTISQKTRETLINFLQKQN